MNNSISFTMLWKIFKDVWLKILIITLVAMLISGIVTEFLITKKYSSTVKFYVINTNEDQDFEQDAIYKTKDLLAGEYIEIILSDKVLQPLSERLKSDYGVEYTRKQLKGMISTRTTPEVGIFDLTVTNADKESAYNIAKLISEISPAIVKGIKKQGVLDPVDCITVLNEPELATTHSSPSLFKNVAIVGMLAILVSYLIFFLITIFDNIIKTGNDLKPFTEKYPLLGTIPVWKEDQ